MSARHYSSATFAEEAYITLIWHERIVARSASCAAGVTPAQQDESTLILASGYSAFNISALDTVFNQRQNCQRFFRAKRPGYKVILHINNNLTQITPRIVDINPQNIKKALINQRKQCIIQPIEKALIQTFNFDWQLKYCLMQAWSYV